MIRTPANGATCPSLGKCFSLNELANLDKRHGNPGGVRLPLAYVSMNMPPLATWMEFGMKGPCMVTLYMSMRYIPEGQSKFVKVQRGVDGFARRAWLCALQFPTGSA